LEEAEDEIKKLRQEMDELSLARSQEGSGSERWVSTSGYSQRHSKAANGMQEHLDHHLGHSSWRDKYVYGLTAGCLGGLSVLLGGCASKSILPIFDGDTAQFGDWFTYYALIGMVVCIVLQTDFLNKAMMAGETMSVFPVYEASWIAFGVGSGIMFYNPRVTWSQDIWEACGVLPMIIGCCFMVLHVDKQKEQDLRDSVTNDTDLRATLSSNESLAQNDYVAAAMPPYTQTPSDNLAAAGGGFGARNPS